MLRSRRWALKSLGSLLLGGLLLPSIASAKKRKKKKKPAPAAAEPPAEAAGEALKDAHLSKRDDRWYLKNRSASQRIIVLLRAGTATDAYSLEAGQEVAVASANTKVSIVTAQYG